MTGAIRSTGRDRQEPRAPIAVAWLLALALHGALLLMLDARLGASATAPERTRAMELVLVRTPEPTLPPARRRAPPVALPASPRAPPVASVPFPLLPLSREEPIVTAAEPPARRDTAGPVRSPLPVDSAVPTSQAPGRARIMLFEPDGRLRVSAHVLEGEPPPIADYIPVPREQAPWEQRVDPLVYEASALEPIWKPDQESLLGEVFRRTTVTKTFRTPWGTKVTCSWVLLVGGCGW